MIGDIHRERALEQAELMDDFSITDERLVRALSDLRTVNRLLGGHAATMSVLAPWLRSHRGRRIRMLDVATGVADFPEHLLRWANCHGMDVYVSGVDLNAKTVDIARRALNQRLSAPLRKRVEIVAGDALSLPFPNDSFDVATSALFMHHLRDDEAIRLLRELERVARHGIIVNDLHRNVLAYYGFRVFSGLMRLGAMAKHDGLISVLRGFTRQELIDLAERACLDQAHVRWHWAFRWTLSTL